MLVFFVICNGGIRPLSFPLIHIPISYLVWIDSS